MPEISIIVPVYKVEAYLSKCVDSILAQTHRDIEVILVDDGSPDRCGDICEEYAKKDGRVRVVHKKNGGLSSARNAGLDIARGDFIGFVDSDDWIEPTMYEAMLSRILNEDADLCICNCFDEDEDGVPVPGIAPSALKNECLTPDAVFRKMVGGGGGVYAGVWNKLYRSSLFENNRFLEGRIHEDEFLAHHILAQCRSVVTVTDVFYHYIRRGGSICQSSYTVKNLDKVWALYDRYAFFKANGYAYEARRTWQAAYGYLIEGLSQLPYRENRAVFSPLIRKIAFESYLDLRTVKILLIAAKKRLCEAF